MWHPPYAVKLTGLLQAGENKLRVVVANTAINEMAGTALPDYRLLNSRYGVRFTPQLAAGDLCLVARQPFRVR